MACKKGSGLGRASFLLQHLKLTVGDDGVIGRGITLTCGGEEIVRGVFGWGST